MQNQGRQTVRVAGLGLSAQAIDQLGQAGHRGLTAEHLLQGHGHAEGLADPGQRLDGDQRVEAQLEQLVAHGQPLQAQKLAPQRGQAPLRLGSWLGVGTVLGLHGLRRGRDQGRAIDFARAAERNLGPDLENGRHHVGR